MTRSPQILAAFVLSALSIAGTYACSDDKEPKGGLVDDPDGGSGSEDDGGGTGGRGGASGSSRIGSTCVRDVDCGGQGLKCLTPDSSDLGGGGPPGGYCVASCDEGGNADCADVDANSICVRFSDSATSPGPAFCVEACTVGQTAAATTKCHNRRDVACDDTINQDSGGVEGFCRPTCRGDFDCGDRKCDLGSGFCVDAGDITGTLPIGAACDPTEAVERCNGACFALSRDDETLGMCGALCSLGNPGCGADPNSSELPAAACLFPLTIAENAGFGDIGLCGQLCNCDDECSAPGRVCRPWGSVEDEEASGFKGYCGGVPEGQTVETIPCDGKPDGGGTLDDGGGTPPPDAGGPAPVTDASAD